VKPSGVDFPRQAEVHEVHEGPFTVADWMYSLARSARGALSTNCLPFSTWMTTR
jgi:hypothetical protein